MVDVSWLSEARQDLDSTDNWHTIAVAADAISVDAIGANCLIRLASVKAIWVAAAVIGIEVISADCKHRR